MQQMLSIEPTLNSTLNIPLTSLILTVPNQISLIHREGQGNAAISFKADQEGLNV